MTEREDDNLLLALRALDRLEPDGERSRVLVERAARPITRRRRAAQSRGLMSAPMYAALIGPVAAGSLSAGYLAAVLIQAIVVFKYAGAGIFLL